MTTGEAVETNGKEKHPAIPDGAVVRLDTEFRTGSSHIYRVGSTGTKVRDYLVDGRPAGWEVRMNIDGKVLFIPSHRHRISLCGGDYPHDVGAD